MTHYPQNRLGRAGGTLSIALLLITTLAATSVDAAVYKWVDENGVTQYSQTPPTDQQAATMRLLPSPSHEATEQAIQDLERRLAESRERDAKANALADMGRSQAAAQQAEFAQRCHHAKQNLFALQQVPRVFYFDDSGERIYINDLERASRIQGLQQDVASYCN